MKIPQSGDRERATERVPVFRIAWTDQSCKWVLEPSFPDGSPPPRWVGASSASGLSFTFGAPRRSLGSLSVKIATFARRNRAKFWCTLSDRTGRTMRRGILGVEEIEDGAYARLMDLSDIVFEVGAEYRIAIVSPNATEEDGCGLLVQDVVPGRSERHRRVIGFSPDRVFTPASSSAETVDAVRHQVVLALRGAWNAPPEWMRQTVGAFTAAFGSVPYPVVDLDQFEPAWRTMTAARVVVFGHVYETAIGPQAISFDAIVFALHRIGVATVFLDTGPFLGPSVRAAVLDNLSAEQRLRRAQRQRCHFALVGGPVPQIECNFDPAYLPRHSDAVQADGKALVDDLSVRVTSGRDAHVVIVSVLYRKADVVGDFISLVLAQSYEGPITLVLVDDLSPENEADIAEGIAGGLEPGGNRRIVVVRQETNSGNCASRLRGLAEVEGDIYVVMDCDCLPNEDFVAAHVFEHWDGKVDVVVGLCNIESGYSDPVAMVGRLEREPGLRLQLAEPQDEVQLDGFLNCITRNFSIKRRLLGTEPLFDLDFSYSKKSGSGFGWEDVEMGYRVYRRGAHIRLAPNAFSVHCTHDPSMPEDAKVLGSMRNFVKLFVKHDELRFVARRWALETYRRIRDWADAIGLEGGDVRRKLDGLFAAPLRELAPLNEAFRIGKTRRLRVLTYRWHVPHQYELYKLPCEFTLVTDLGMSMVDSWGYEQRPLPRNVRFLQSDRVDVRDYDVAILHFDENVNCAELSNGTIPAVWGDPFRRFLAIADLPKVAICHGTPAFEGQYGLDPGRKTRFVEHRRRKGELVSLLAGADVHVVCNSHQAHREWGFARSSVIWHGFDPQQFPPGTMERHVLALSPDRHRPHYRGAWEHETVLARLESGIRVETAAHPGCPVERRDTNAFAEKNFRSYIDRIRQFTVYLNTTLRSPMPRSRGEAMMTGVIPVCLTNHDVDLFIDNGRNGFVSTAPEELADFINFVFAHPEEARRIGDAARLTALDVFNHDRYLQAWTQLLSAAVGRTALRKAV